MAIGNPSTAVKPQTKAQSGENAALSRMSEQAEEKKIPEISGRWNYVDPVFRSHAKYFEQI